MLRFKPLLIICIPILIAIQEPRFSKCDLYALDKIIAIVNNDAVTQKDLDDFTNFMRMQLSQEYSGGALNQKIESIKSGLLERLIEDRLILQEAKSMLEQARKNKDLRTVSQLEIDPNTIKAKITEVKKNYEKDSDFQADLTKQGLNQADLEAKIKEQLLMYRAIELRVKENIIIAPDEITNFYNKNLKTFVSGEERELDVITLEDKELAKTLSYNLRTGAKIEDLATRFPFTLNKLKVMPGEEFRKEIKDVIFKLGLTEISEPVKIGNKYYIFKLLEITPPRQLSLSEVQDKIQAYLFEEKMKEGLSRWLAELKKKSYIQIISN
jgi:parvulin-like peptidyl-prolyl isomerase